MASLQDLGKLAEDGLVKIKAVQEKHKNPKTGQEVAEIANSLSNTIMSDYHSFVKDQRAALVRRAEMFAEELKTEGVNQVKIIGDMGDTAVSKCRDVVKQAELLMEKANVCSRDIDELVHSEKERFTNEFHLAETSVKEKILNVAGEIDTLMHEAEGLVHEAVSKVESVDTAISNGRTYLNEVANEMKDALRIEIERSKEKIVQDVVEYIVKNAFSIVGKFIKGIFRKKQ